MSGGEGPWKLRVDQLEKLGFYDRYGYLRGLFSEGVRNFKKEPGGVLLPAVETEKGLESYLGDLWKYVLIQCRDEIILEWVLAFLKERERERYEAGEPSKDFSDYKKLVEENKNWLEQKKKELENHQEYYLYYMEWMRANVNNYKPFWMNNQYKNFSKILKGVVE